MNTNTEDKLRMGDEASLAKMNSQSVTKEDVASIKNLDPTTFTESYTLDYKAVHNVGRATFKGPEDFKSVLTLAHAFCSKRNWRFIQVRPLFTDILSEPQSEEERAKYGKDRN